VDGSSSKVGSGARIFMEGSRDVNIKQSLILKFKTSNNQPYLS